MPQRTIALYATETMADWEYAYLTAQIATIEKMRPGRFRLLIVGDGLDPVTSLGGMPVAPSSELDELVRDGSLACLVIPGGEHYAQGHERLIDVTRSLVDRGVPVAAICGGTLLLARSGLLDTRLHTSNAPVFLGASGYRGTERYVDQPVVTDQGVTTAGGIHAIPFTAEVMRLTGLNPVEMADAWERLLLTGEPQHYGELTQATEAWLSS
ncbi:MAG: DJ-1/PfpI family protein [Actinomyces sp.]|nr:DJ-1/PfpI family protein [Actinomyces sp.]MDO4242339.1 DJ-1/PfpI family protein [Actinomyces sp.]